MTASTTAMEQTIRAALRDCYDPTLPCNIVDLGVVESITLTPDPEAPGATIPGVPPKFRVHHHPHPNHTRTKPPTPSSSPRSRTASPASRPSSTPKSPSSTTPPGPRNASPPQAAASSASKATPTSSR